MTVPWLGSTELPSDLGDGQCTAALLVARYAKLIDTTRKASDQAAESCDGDTSQLLTGAFRALDQAFRLFARLPMPRICFII